MSLHDELQSDHSHESQKQTSKSFERYDLTGHRIRRWTVSVRERLFSTLRKFLDYSKKAAKQELPGTSETLEEKGRKLPGRTIQFIENSIDKTSVENQLKIQQTETEFFRQELLKMQISKTRAETETQNLENVSRKLEICKRIKEITEGKTDIHFMVDEDVRKIIFGTLPLELDSSYVNLSASISRLGLSKRIESNLTNGGIICIQQLVNRSKTELLKIDGIGRQSVKEIEISLDSHGWALK